MYTLEIIGDGIIPSYRRNEFIERMEKILKELNRLALEEVCR